MDGTKIQKPEKIVKYPCHGQSKKHFVPSNVLLAWGYMFL